MTIWVISDTHFGHENVIRYSGRPFTSAAEMDEAMVARRNAVVQPSDKVYHLGDLTMRKAGLKVVSRLHGQKRLIRGNHDIFKTRAYQEAGFPEIHGVRVLGGCLLSHFPVHPGSLGRYLVNIHGHLHQQPAPEGRYLNACVEWWGYQPVALDTLIAGARERWGSQP